MSTTFPTAPPLLTESDPVASARLDDLDLTFSTDAERAAAITALQAVDAALASDVASRQPAATASTDFERDAAIEAHRADTTDVHGLIDTANLTPMLSLGKQYREAGLKAISGPPETFSSGGSIGTGTVQLARLSVRRTETFDGKLHFVVQTSASGLTYARAALFAVDGQTQLAISADISGGLGIGYKLVDLPAIAGTLLQAADYWVALLQIGTTPGALLRAASSGNHAQNLGKTGASLRFANGPIGQAAMPATVDPTTFTPTPGAHFWGLA